MKKTFILIIVILILGLVGEGIKLADKNLKLELIRDSEVQVEVNSEYNDSGAEARFFNKDMTSKIKRTGKVDTSKLGEYEIKYEFQDREVIRKVIVKDTQKPEITLKGSESVTIPYDTKYQEDGYTATDNYDGDITQNVEISGETVNDITKKIIYTVKDSSGNETTKERIIITEPKKEEEQQVAPSTNTNDGKSVIYLTFDDGPSRSITPYILDILKEENVKATFFVINFDSNEEYLIKRIVNEGHSIGIHGYSHNYKEIYKSVDGYMDNVRKLQSKIKNLTGITTIITRFPGGSSNTVSRFNPGVMTRLTKEVLKQGFKYYDWNVGSGDSGGAKKKEQVYNNVTKGLKKGRRNVVLMHDFSGNKKTLNALKDIIEYGKKKGYSFDRITENTPMVTQRVQN